MKRLIMANPRESTIEEINPDAMVKLEYGDTIKMESDHFPVMKTMANGIFAYKAVALSNHFDWHLGVDESGAVLLVPTRKINKL
jgi:hypothetical protein